MTAVDVLSNQAIHGIIVEDDSIFVWGGHFICQLAARNDSDGSLVLDVGPIVEAEDWILDGSFCPASSERSPRVALVTAHNALCIASLSQSLTLSLQTQVAGSNCILYAAHVKWISASTCLIASGTAFGDVIVWSYSVDEEEGELYSTHQLHYNFSAHEGSVFGVQISSPSMASALGGRKHILATCSDDRTIRLWDVSTLGAISRSTEGERETGFGSQSILDSSAPACLCKAMGHISRIWHVHFVQALPAESQAASNHPVHVVSFGEDATCITWELWPDGQDEDTYTLKQLDVQKAHAGKHIWSVAIGGSKRIATGGADGSIALRSFEDLRGHAIHRDTGNSAISEDNQADSFRTYAFIGRSTLVATTNSGTMLLLDLHTEGGVTSKQISPAMEQLRGYSIMAGVPDIAFSAGTQGCVYAYIHAIGEVLSVTETGSKVAGLFSQPSRGMHTSSGLLVANVASSTAMYCRITLSPTSSASSANVQVVKSTFTLPPGFVVTSFDHTSHSGQVFVILGSRSGSIVVYVVSDTDEPPLAHRLLHSSIHGKEAVTCLRFLEETDPNNLLFLSTGRDGTYAGHTLDLVSDDLRMETVHQLALPFGPNVEHLDYSLDGHIWIWGFRSKQFVVWDFHTQQEVMKVECGGANRNWAFQVGENGGTFVWTKASRVYDETHSRLPFQSINTGGHGREIKSLAISPTEPQLIATGAEDTDIKLSTYSKGAIQCLHTLKKHVTGIQHLQWSTDGHYLFSSAGFEEFYIWRVCYDVPTLRIGVICESAHPNSGTSDLRIMHFGARCDNSNDQTIFNITMIYSDSSVRAWRYVSKTWSLLATGSYLTSCLTQCLLPSNGETGLITASTDGHMSMWKIATERNCMEWTSRHPVHQSAILSLVSSDLADGSRLIITGGDDNALGITRVGKSCEDTRTLLVTRAHAAAVTALAIVGKVQSCRLWIVSASIDQRVKLWQIDLDLEKSGVGGVDIKLLQNSFSAVADISSVDPIRLPAGERGVLICGVGMDFWKISEM